MPFHIERNDITRMRVDAIVNAANPGLLGGGGVDGAIHRAAGPKLRKACEKLGGCETGHAKYTKGYDLPARWVIHTVGPIWCGGTRGEEALLASCYRESLATALGLGCKSVAFPLISAGAYGYPKDQALSVAVREIGAFLLQNELDVTLVVFDAGSYRLSASLLSGVQAYIDQNYVDAAPQRESLVLAAQRQEALCAMDQAATYAGEDASASDAPAHMNVGAQTPAPMAAPRPASPRSDAGPRGSGRQRSGLAATPAGLDERLRSLDESFSEMLLRKIDEKGMTDAACYKKANVDRKLFSKIRSDPHYRPSKQTAIAFAVALELPLDEAKEMLRKAGFALSHSNRFDVIIEYFIANGRYDVFEINETLFAFDQNLLGA